MRRIRITQFHKGITVGWSYLSVREQDISDVDICARAKNLWLIPSVFELRPWDKLFVESSGKGYWVSATEA